MYTKRLKTIMYISPQFVDSALSTYELTCSEASSAGVDIVTREFSYNWDYIQSCFFSLTILTTIGRNISALTTQTIFCSGYGNFATETFGGRLFCLFFGIFALFFSFSRLLRIRLSCRDQASNLLFHLADLVLDLRNIAIFDRS